MKDAYPFQIVCELVFLVEDSGETQCIL